MFTFKLQNQLSANVKFSQKLCTKLVVVISLVALTSCSSVYYSVMEKVEIHKSDIMVDRVEEAKES